MQITNTKTGVTHSTRTTKTVGGYASCVTKRVGNTETLIAREVYPTRARAYRSAVMLCKSHAANHAYVN
jgi:hypothetical protein